MTEKWNILKSTCPNFRISKDTGLTFAGSETECKQWLEDTFSPIEYKVNELFHTITYLERG